MPVVRVYKILDEWWKIFSVYTGGFSNSSYNAESLSLSYFYWIHIVDVDAKGMECSHSSTSTLCSTQYTVTLFIPSLAIMVVGGSSPSNVYTGMHVFII